MTLMTRIWPVLALSACALRPSPAPVAPASPMMSVAVVPEPAPAPTFVDPPAPPCPTPGWATTATLTGAWQGGHVSRRSDDPPPSYLGLPSGEQVWLRHDYHPDGTATRVELSRRHGLADSQRREQQTGTWRVDPSGELELSWRTPSLSRTSRERVWIAVAHSVPGLRRRALERGADGVWRGARWFEEATLHGGAYGHEVRLELRFSPPLAPDARACEVEITRVLKVWGHGEPATWKNRARRRCEIIRDRVLIDVEPAASSAVDPADSSMSVPPCPYRHR